MENQDNEFVDKPNYSSEKELKDLPGISIDALPMAENYQLFTDRVGRGLVIRKTEREILIMESRGLGLMTSNKWVTEMKNIWHLRATVDENAVMRLELRTRKNTLFGKKRSPIMNAKKFVGESIEYFDSQGIPPNVFEARWDHDEDNLKQYQENLTQLDWDPVRAARETWTGRNIAPYGFTEVSPEDISTEGPQDALRMKVRFHREAKSP